MTNSVSTRLLERFNDYQNKTAIIMNGNTYTYKELHDTTRHAFSDLHVNKINPNDTVGIICDYSFVSICYFLALFQNNNIVVPIVETTEAEMNDKLDVAKANKTIQIENERVVISDRKIDFPEDKKTIITNKAPHLLLFSSGSTGKPKGMLQNLNTLFEIALTKKPKNIRILTFLAFDHIGGFNTLSNALSMGATIIIPKDRSVETICSLIEKHSVTVLPTTPTFLNLILMHETYQTYDLSSLRLITYGTEPMTNTTLLKYTQLFPRIKFLQTFGTSETGIARTFSKSSASTYFKIDDPNMEYKIINDELFLKSSTQVYEYINHEANNISADGWFATGDIVEKDADGYIKIVGRKNEVVNVGGLKVFPSEVESVILELPFVNDCVVFGESNAITGQIVCAKIMLNESKEVESPKNIIIEHCRNILDKYKIPIKIKFVGSVEYSDRFKKKRIGL